MVGDKCTVSIQTLAALENAIEPYLDAGYIITSQTDLSITLLAPLRRFSWIFFLFSLLLVWPVAVIYVVWFNQRGDRSLCVRITAQGRIEESGFVLDLLIRERRQQRIFIIAFLLLAVAIIGLFIIRFAAHH